jgi:hypothetical protein
MPMGISAAAVTTVCLITGGFHPGPGISEETVDVIELNHFHDDQGRPVFDQILFYDWSASDGRYQLRDWRLLKSPNQIPLANTRDREYVAVWNDPKTVGGMRATKAKIVRETWTHLDPELVEREFLPEHLRRRLKEIPTQRREVAGAESSSGTGSRPAENTGPSAVPLRPLQTPAPRPL